MPIPTAEWPASDLLRLKAAVQVAKMRCPPPPERIVRDTMGLLHVTMSIASTHRESVRPDLPHTLVDTGAVGYATVAACRLVAA